MSRGIQLNTAELAHRIVDIMGERQASDIVMLDIRPVSLITDYFVIGTGETRRQLTALSEAIIDNLRKEANTKPLATDGTPDSGWIILDYGSVVVHLFAPGERAYYKLEQLWQDAILVVRLQ